MISTFSQRLRQQSGADADEANAMKPMLNSDYNWFNKTRSWRCELCKLRMWSGPPEGVFCREILVQLRHIARSVNCLGRLCQKLREPRIEYLMYALWPSCIAIGCLVYNQWSHDYAASWGTIFITASESTRSETTARISTLEELFSMNASSCRH